MIRSARRPVGRERRTTLLLGLASALFAAALLLSLVGLLTWG
jgi:hypothetical protein